LNISSSVRMRSPRTATCGRPATSTSGSGRTPGTRCACSRRCAGSGRRIDGLTFEEAWRERLAVSFAGTRAAVLSVQHLIRNKRAVGRPQDLADVDWLEKASRK